MHFIFCKTPFIRNSLIYIIANSLTFWHALFELSCVCVLIFKTYQAPFTMSLVFKEPSLLKLCLCGIKQPTFSVPSFSIGCTIQIGYTFRFLTFDQLQSQPLNCEGPSSQSCEVKISHHWALKVPLRIRKYPESAIDRMSMVPRTTHYWKSLSGPCDRLDQWTRAINKPSKVSYKFLIGGWF